MLTVVPGVGAEAGDLVRRGNSRRNARTLAAATALWLVGCHSMCARASEIGARQVPPAGPAQASPVVELSAAFRSDVGDRVFFADGSAELGRRARVALQAQALWLLKHSRTHVIIEGHADDLASDDANRALAERRAEMVRERLLELGVAAPRLGVVAHGSKRPAALCGAHACAGHNRRVVLRITHATTSAGPPTPENTSVHGVRASLRRLF